MKIVVRPSKDQYYLNIAKEVAKRSTCFRARNGSIIVRDDQIIATGYVGAPRKTKDCFERGNCLRDIMKIPHGERYELCRSVHAEMNCVSENSLTVLPDGEIKKIKEVHSPLLVLDTSNFKIRRSKGKRFEKEKKEAIKIITSGNHEIEVSPDHEMFVADKLKILGTKKAKDLTLNDFLPFVVKINIRGANQSLPEVPFTSYSLTQKGIEIFKKHLKEIGWQKLANKCKFSIMIIKSLNKGRGVERRNKDKIIKLYPELSSFFRGLNFHQVKIPQKTSPDFCQIAGYFTGDGSVGKRYIAFYDKNKEILKHYQALCKKVFNLRGNIIKRKGNWRLCLCSYRLSFLFSKLDFGKGAKRKIPIIFHKVPEDSLARFLQGFADAEGTVGERAIHISSSSRELINNIKMLFLRFGIVPSIYKGRKSERFKGYKSGVPFSLEITGSDIKVFYEKIGFSHPLKQRKLEKIIKKSDGRKKFSLKVYFKEWFRGNFPTTYFPLLRDYRNDIISRESAKRILINFEKFDYNQKNLLKLKNLVENIAFLKIKKIQKIKKQLKMIDYFVPKFNSFLVNGFIVHNCIINAARAGVSLLGGTLYLYSEDREGNRVDAFPCFFCKRMIINAGLERVVCSAKNDGDIRVFYVQDWVNEWREKDIIDDKYKYGFEDKKLL